MRKHGGYDSTEMPRAEIDRDTRRAGPTVATRAIDTALGVPAAPRARRGDRVEIWVDVVKPD